jgi:hypothetical protein
MEKQENVLESKSQLTWADYTTGLVTPKVIWRRLNHQGHRFYFSKINDKIETAIGITSVIDLTFGESKFLREWKDSRPEWKKDLRLMADYGTLLHAAFGELIKTGVVPKYMIEMADNIFNKKLQFKKDLLSLKKFLIDYKVNVVFLEGILAKEYTSINGIKSYICTAIDFFGTIEIPIKKKEMVEDGEYVRGDKKGEKKYKEVTSISYKSINAVIDLKSNFDHKEAKSFFESHKYQLIFGKELIESSFDIDNVRMFNLSTLGWNKEPKFILTEHTDDINRMGYKDSEILANRINTAMIENKLKPNGHIYEINDEITIESSDVRVLSYEEMAEEVLESLK